MRCLTLHQPWASLVAAGVKTIETRSWRTSHRGQLLIHAGKPWARQAFADLAEYLYVGGPSGPELRYRHPLSAVVAVAQLVDCVPIVGEGLPEGPAVMPMRGQLWSMNGPYMMADITAQLPFGDFTPGRWAWLLDDIRPLPKPVPASGRQGLWTPSYEEFARIGDQIEAVTRG